jgi:uncharacterized damage-inducible protein DinB
MNADAFRYLYEYHFNENRKLWTRYIADLPQDQFIQPIAYSLGSIRNHIMHLINVDLIWFSELQNLEIADLPDNDAYADKGQIRDYWDSVEQKVRGYLATLRDDMLFTKPIHIEEEDKNLMVWQVLLHVVNHATDHRAQILRLLHDAGVKTGPQDFIFYVYDHP